MNAKSVERTRELLQMDGPEYVRVELLREDLASSLAEADSLIAEAQQPSVAPTPTPTPTVEAVDLTFEDLFSSEDSDVSEQDTTEDDDDDAFTTESDLINFLKDDRNNPSVYSLRQFLGDFPARRPFTDYQLEELFRRVRPDRAAVDGGIAMGAEPEGRDCQAYPPELRKLVESGEAFYSNYTNGRPNHWMVKKCSVCHNFNRDECCGQPTVPTIAENSLGKLTRAAKQALGLEPIEPPKTPERKEKERIEGLKDQPWMINFRGAGELSGSGKVEFLIENFLAKGVTYIGGPPEYGKSFIGMSITKALTTGQALFGKLKVIETAPVLWLAAEGGDNGLKIRCKAFGITDDKTKFICRTLSQGAMLQLDDDNIESLVRQMHPVVILETAVRFGDGEEDSASDANKIGGAVFRLISYGARAVIAIHHSTKNFKKAVSLETALRGSSDFAAQADVVIVPFRDEALYKHGLGPCEIDLISCKGRDFTPPPIRLALTEKAPEGTALADLWSAGLVSCINRTGDLKWVDKVARTRAIEISAKDIRTDIDQMVEDNPAITVNELVDATGQARRTIDQVLKELGWTKPRGRAKKGETNLWVKADERASAA